MKTLSYLVCFAFLAAVLSSCAQSTQVYSNSFMNQLKKDHWRIWELPAGGLGAGTLVTITDDGLPDPSGNLQSCKVPMDVLFDPGPLSHHPFPVTSLGDNQNFDLGLAASFKGIGGSVDYNRVRKVSVDIQDAGWENLDSAHVKGFIKTKLQSLDPDCYNAIRSGKEIVLKDAAYITKGTITFYGDDKGTLQLDKVAVIKALDLSPKFQADVQADGKLVFNQPIYVGYREADQPWESATLALMSPTSQLDDAVAKQRAAEGLPVEK